MSCSQAECLFVNRALRKLREVAIALINAPQVRLTTTLAERGLLVAMKPRLPRNRGTEPIWFQ